MSNKDEAFWIVWSPTGTSPPRKRHDDHAAAHAEAERLANLSPAAQFYVLKAIERVEHRTTVTVTLVEPEGMPF